MILRHALASLKYHKRFLRRYLLCLVLFLPILFLLHTLRATLLNLRENITNRVQEGVLPEVDQRWLTLLFTDLKSVLPLYNVILGITCLLFAGVLFFLSRSYCRSRQCELVAYRRLGMTRRHFIGQLALELVIPAFVLLVCLALVCIVFQSSIETAVQWIQSRLLDRFTDVAKMVTPSGTSDSSNFPIRVGLPENGLLLLATIPFDSIHWLKVTLVALGGTALTILSLIALALVTTVITIRRCFTNDC